MGIYLKKFETMSQYNAYTADTENFIKPNVSLITETRGVTYNPSTPPAPVETRVVATFNVTDTSNPTPIGYNEFTSGFSAIEIDGVEQPSVVSAYTFSTTGEHTVKYTLTDPTSIGFAFFTLDKLASISIPNSVTSIGQNAFWACSGLTSCTIGSGVTSIGYRAFGNCKALTSITIPNSVTSIGDSVFINCSGLTNVTISNAMTTIEGYDFAACTSLTNVIIPSNITWIGTEAFRGCSGLTSITVEATTPPTLQNADAFYNTNNCPIYVPSGSVDAYKSASGWSDYESRIQAIQ